MKRIVFIISIFIISFSTQAQDSAFARTVTMPARAWEYLAGVYSIPLTPTDEEFFIDLKKKFRVATPPVNNQSVTIDSIELGTVVKLYQFIKNVRIAEGEDLLATFKGALIQPRTTNPYLDAEIVKTEQYEMNKIQSTRAFGRARLLKVRN